MSHSHQYAQTNLQLYAQLCELNFPGESLAAMRQAYELASRLFSGRYRANGKPFIAHLVGTASILAAYGADSKIAIAGMLHAAYLQGQFGDGKSGITANRTRLIRRYVGNEVAELMAEYTRLPWENQVLDEFQSSPERLSSCNPDIIFIRLANDLEDHLDQGMLYCHKPVKGLPNDGAGEPVIVNIARQLGYHNLAAELAAVYREERQTQVPEELCIERKSSFTVGPYRPGCLMNLVTRLRKLFHRTHDQNW